MSFSDERFCTKCGARLPTNSGRCSSCGYDPKAAAGGSVPESLAQKVERLETNVAALTAPKKSVTAKIKRALAK